MATGSASTWSFHRKAKLRSSTRRSYRKHIDLYLRPGLGHIRLSGLRDTDVEQLILAWTVAHSSAHADGTSGGLGKSPRFWIFAAIPLVVIALEFAVLLWLRRRGVGWLQPSPTLGLARRERRRLMRAIRQAEQLSGPDGELARDLARRLVEQRWLIVVCAAMLVFEVVVVLLRGLDVLGVLLLVGTVGAAVALLFAVRDVRRARTYLGLDTASNRLPEP